MVNSVSINTGMKIPLCHVDCISCGSYPAGGAGLYHNRCLSMVCEEISTDFWHGYEIWILTNKKNFFFLHSYRHLLYLLFLVSIDSSPPTRYDSLSLWLCYIFQIISSMSSFFQIVVCHFYLCLKIFCLFLSHVSLLLTYRNSL